MNKLDNPPFLREITAFSSISERNTGKNVRPGNLPELSL